MATLVPNRNYALITSVVAGEDFEVLTLGAKQISVSISNLDLGKFHCCIGDKLRLSNEKGSVISFRISSYEQVSDSILLVTANYDEECSDMYLTGNTVGSCKWLVLNYRSCKERSGIYLHRDICGTVKSIIAKRFATCWYGDWIKPSDNNKVTLSVEVAIGDVVINTINNTHSHTVIKKRFVLGDDSKTVAFSNRNNKWNDAVYVLSYKVLGSQNPFYIPRTDHRTTLDLTRR